MDEGKPILRIIVLRLAAAVLEDRLHRLDRRAGEDPAKVRGRHGGDADLHQAAKAPARQRMGQRIAEHLTNVRRWAADKKIYQGDGVDAAVVGYLCAFLSGNDESLPELKAELAAVDRPGVIDGIAGSDYSMIVCIVCGIDPRLV